MKGWLLVKLGLATEELFAQRLARALAVRVADVRPLDSYSDEAHRLRTSVKGAQCAAGEGAKVLSVSEVWTWACPFDRKIVGLMVLRTA